jgi:molecular chaperone GrpE
MKQQTPDNLVISQLQAGSLEPTTVESPEEPPPAEPSVPASNITPGITPLADGSSRVLQDLLYAATKMNVTLGHLNETVQSRLTYDKTKEEAFDRLYSELEQLKANASFDQLRPLYLDLILLFDRIENICQSAPPTVQEAPDILALFKSLRDEIVEILYRREIEIIPSSPASFDPTTQRAIGVETTSEEAQSGGVAKIVRRGFRYRNRIIRSEEVIVKKLASSASELASVDGGAGDE